MRIWFLLSLLLLAACARPELPPMPLPEAGDLLQRLAQGRDAYRTLDGEARVAMKIEGKFYSSQQFLLLEKPDRLRADVLTPFGQLILQLAVNNNELSAFNNTKVPGTFYLGDASDDNLARFTRLPLRFSEMMRLFLYDPPLIGREEVRVSSHQRGALLEIIGRDRRQEIVFDRQLRPVESSYYRHGAVWLKVGYDEFSELDGFPKKIRLELPQGGTSASVRFSQVKTNMPIPAERFVIEQPANATLQRLPQ